MANPGDLAHDRRFGRPVVLVRRLDRAPAAAPASQIGMPWWEAWSLEGVRVLLPERALRIAGRPTHDQLLELIEWLSVEQLRELAFLFPSFTRRVLHEQAAKSRASGE